MDPFLETGTMAFTVFKFSGYAFGVPGGSSGAGLRVLDLGGRGREREREREGESVAADSHDSLI